MNDQNRVFAELHHLEGLFDDAVARARVDVAAADEELAALLAMDEPPVENGQAELLEAFATGPHAPREWQDVARRVAVGETDWRAIADGAAMSDPSVRAAVDATARMGLLFETGQPPRTGGAELPTTAEDPTADDDFSLQTVLQNPWR